MFLVLDEACSDGWRGEDSVSQSRTVFTPEQSTALDQGHLDSVLDYSVLLHFNPFHSILIHLFKYYFSPSTVAFSQSQYADMYTREKLSAKTHLPAEKIKVTCHNHQPARRFFSSSESHHQFPPRFGSQTDAPNGEERQNIRKSHSVSVCLCACVYVCVCVCLHLWYREWVKAKQQNIFVQYMYKLYIAHVIYIIYDTWVISHHSTGITSMKEHSALMTLILEWNYYWNDHILNYFDSLNQQLRLHITKGIPLGSAHLNRYAVVVSDDIQVINILMELMNHT